MTIPNTQKTVFDKYKSLIHTAVFLGYPLWYPYLTAIILLKGSSGFIAYPQFAIFLAIVIFVVLYCYSLYLLLKGKNKFECILATLVYTTLLCTVTPYLWFDAVFRFGNIGI